MATLGLAVLAAASASGQEATKPFTEAGFDANFRQVVERDYFPVLDNPANVTVDEARAYPVAVMGKHELANDVVGGEPITV